MICGAQCGFCTLRKAVTLARKPSLRADSELALAMVLLPDGEIDAANLAGGYKTYRLFPSEPVETRSPAGDSSAVLTFTK